MKYRFLFLLIILTSLCNAQSMQYDLEMHKVIQEGLDYCYNLEFKKAEEKFELVKKKYPNHPAYDFTTAVKLYWMMLAENAQDKYAADYLAHLNNTITLADKRLKTDNDDVEGIFFNLAAYSSLVLYYSEKDEVMKTISYARKTYSYMRQGFDLKSKFDDFYFTSGLYDYFAVKYPEAYPAYKPFMYFFASGDKQKGLEELDYAINKAIFTKTEALSYATEIYLKYEGNYQKALESTTVLAKKYPANNYFHIRHTEALLGTGKTNDAEIYAWKLYNTNNPLFKMTSLVFYGEINERRNKTEDARLYYLSAIKKASEVKSPVSNYVGMAYAGLARIADKKGDEDLAIDYYEKALSISHYKSTREEAEKYLDDH